MPVPPDVADGRPEQRLPHRGLQRVEQLGRVVGTVRVVVGRDRVEELALAHVALLAAARLRRAKASPSARSASRSSRLTARLVLISRTTDPS